MPERPWCWTFRKAIGPVAFSSIFAWSLSSWGWNGHGLVFYILVAILVAKLIEMRLFILKICMDCPLLKRKKIEIQYQGRLFNDADHLRPLPSQLRWVWPWAAKGGGTMGPLLLVAQSFVPHVWLFKNFPRRFNQKMAKSWMFDGTSEAMISMHFDGSKRRRNTDAWNGSAQLKSIKSDRNTCDPNCGTSVNCKGRI